MGTTVILAAIVGLVAYTLGSKRRHAAERPTKTTRSVTYADQDFDSWEGGMWDAPDPHKVSARIGIEYVDAAGQRTSRKVLVREFDNTLHGGVLMGMCELRNAHRTFRFDRIKSCVNLETGEVIKDTKAFLNEAYEKSPERSAELLTSDYLDALKVVYFVAKADGQYRQAEKDVVTRFVQILVRDARITTELIDIALKSVPVPSMQSFKLAVGRILKGGQVDPALLSQCCKEIVATQTAVHPSEQEALDYIEKALAKFPNSNSPTTG